MKRALDVLMALSALLLLSPLLLAAAAAIALESGRPILFRQTRLGLHGREFPMYKFRSMVVNAAAQGPYYTSDADPRITRVGRWLRRTSIDELPQLLNVLKGDMSLVGPRPALHSQDDLVALRTAAGVDALRPGLTGWAQINGRDELPIPEKARLDREYLDRMSPAFDVKILAATARAALSGRGVSH